MFKNIEIEKMRHHLSKTELASRLNVPPSVLDDWICKRQAIPAEKLRVMWHLFDGVSVDYLLREC
ncbi:MAG: helix-turn-helix domain containing protein [Defluviitaleaceae bacterium]|nr:helix-turn-helix domain containing protein [Defluviitaleaceae bacterium]